MSAKILTDISDATHPNSTVSARVWDMYIDNDLIIGGVSNVFATRGVSRSMPANLNITGTEEFIDFSNLRYTNPNAGITYTAPDFVVDFNGFIRFEFNGTADTVNVAKNAITVRVYKNLAQEKLISASGTGGASPDFDVVLSCDVTLPVVIGDTISVTIESDLGTGVLDAGASAFITRLFP